MAVYYLLCRGAKLGSALRRAVEASPTAFRNVELSDIQETLDYFAMPPTFLHEHLGELMCGLTYSLLPGHCLPHPNQAASASGLHRLCTMLRARVTALNIALALCEKAPSWATWHGGMYFALVVPTEVDLGLAPGCMFFDLPDPIKHDEESDWTEAHAKDPPTVRVLERLTEMRMDPHKSWVEGDRLEVPAEWVERFTGKNDPRRCSAGPPDLEGVKELTDLTVLTPAASPAFCCVALVQELEGMGLRASWHQGPLRLVPPRRYTEVELASGQCNTSHFLFVSWM